MTGRAKGVYGRHTKIIDLHLLGHKVKDIATMLEMTPVGVGRILSVPHIQDEILRLRAQMRTVLSEKRADVLLEDPLKSRIEDPKTLTDAWDRNVELMQSPDTKVAQRSVWDILDRAGYKPKEKVEHTVQDRISPKDQELLREALRESDEMNGGVPPDGKAEEAPLNGELPPVETTEEQEEETQLELPL